MAKRRTRREKELAKHTSQPIYTIEESDSLPPAAAAVMIALPTAMEASAYSLHTDTVLIKKDILKSVLLAVLILGIEFAIYAYWQF